MKHTPKEIAELLKDKPHQPHYIESLVKKAIEEEREACACLLEREAKEWEEYDISDEGKEQDAESNGLYGYMHQARIDELHEQAANIRARSNV